MRFKKILVVLFTVFFVPLTVTSALGVIPHVHGKDFNHSQNESCPVHQIGSLAVDFNPNPFQGPEIGLLGRIRNLQETSFSSKFFSFISLRAPPTSIL